jgi:hypothetical protein
LGEHIASIFRAKNISQRENPAEEGGKLNFDSAEMEA